MANLSKPLNQGFAAPSIVGNYGPYASVAAAHAALADDELNVVGMTVGIQSGNTIEEYWYQGGTTQAHLVPKKPDLSDKANKSEMSVTDGTGANSDKITITLKSGTNATVLKSHQSLAGKQDVIDTQHKLSADLVDDSTTTNKFTNATEKQTWNGKQDALVSGTNIKTINNESILGGGNITIQPQVQSDWNQTDSTADDFIKNKPTIPTVPTNVSAYNNDAGYLTQHQSLDNYYTKTEVNGLVDTPHQEYVTVDAYASLPVSGSTDTIYRVSGWDGSANSGAGAADDTVYSEYAWNGTQYIFLCVKSQIGEVFDITVYNSNTKYADLADALSTNGANVPQNLRKGGMSVKFVQSYDNKYVQYRLMSDTFNTTPANWQGVDDKPIAGSDNLVKSDGIAKYVSSIVGGILETSIPSIGKLVKYPFITLGKGWYKLTVTPDSNSDVLKVVIYNQQDTLIGSLTNQSNSIEFEITSEVETLKYYRGSTDTVDNNSTILVQNMPANPDSKPIIGSNTFVKSDGIAKYGASILGGILETNIPSINNKTRYPFITLGKGLYKITITPNSESDTLAVNIYKSNGDSIGTLTNQSNSVEFEITNEAETLTYYRGNSDTVNNNSTILVQNITTNELGKNIKVLQDIVSDTIGFDISDNFSVHQNETVQIPILVDFSANNTFYIKTEGPSDVILDNFFKLRVYSDADGDYDRLVNLQTLGNETPLVFDFDVKKVEIVKTGSQIYSDGEFTYNITSNIIRSLQYKVSYLEKTTFYVNGTTGNDDYDGLTSAKPFKTFAKAVEKMANCNNSILYIAKGTYKERLNILSLKGSVSIYGQTNEEVIISGSEVITGWEAVSGYQGIYKALFDGTIPIHGGHNLNRGIIYEVGRSSGLIDTSERHPSQKGLSYRLPFTPIQQCLAQTLDAALSDISENGGWYIDGGYIYVKNADGSNPETNGYSYEYEKNGTFVSSNEIEHLLISNISFRYTTSVIFNALFTERYNCSVIGCPTDGFKDSSYRLRSYFDECAFCGNDGANGHFNSVTNWEQKSLRNSGEIVEYYYAWMHDNLDDGLSHHEASHIRVMGGLYEYNGDGGIRVSNTSNTEVFSAYFRKNGQDNSAASAKGSGIDCVNTALTGDARNGCNTVVYDCVSEDNKIGYGCLDTNNIITLINCISSNNSIAELYANAGKVITKNCKYIQPDISKVKVVENNGEILVNNYLDFA